MKKITLGTIMATTIALTACSSFASKNNEKQIGMPNPASEYCIKKGGKLIQKEDKNGAAYSLCQLPNGKTMEEWDFFRNNH